MTYWLDRLECLPDAVDDFIRNTSLMLEDYFEDLSARSLAAYAEAYEKYRRMMNTAFQFAAAEDVIDGDLDSVQLSFPVRLGFRAMEAKDGGAVFGFAVYTVFLQVFLARKILGAV